MKIKENNDLLSFEMHINCLNYVQILLLFSKVYFSLKWVVNLKNVMGHILDEFSSLI